MEKAETLPKEQRAEFIQAAKSHIEPFEKILNQHGDVYDPDPPPAAPIKPNVNPEEGERSGKNNLGRIKQGEPGITIEQDPDLSRRRVVVSRDKAEPKPKPATPKKEAAKPETKEPNSNVEPEAGPADPEMASRVKNQLDSAKAKGIKKLKFTIERGGNQKPMEIGVNAELDTPESLAAKIAKAGGAGKVQIESADPDHPLKWSFYVGGSAAPPGAK